MNFLARILLIAVTVLVVVFAVANRQMVTLGFDPFDTENPIFGIRMPLFLLVLLSVLIGILIGGAATWLRQSKWRRKAREKRKEAADLGKQIEKLEQTPSSGRAPRLGPPTVGASKDRAA